jgi:hypothetical protein
MAVHRQFIADSKWKKCSVTKPFIWSKLSMKREVLDHWEESIIFTSYSDHFQGRWSACRQKGNIRRYKSKGVSSANICFKTYGYLYFLSSEMPSRLSTNTLNIGEYDQSEGVRWLQSPLWSSRSVVARLTGMFHKLQFINLYKYYFIYSRWPTNQKLENENMTAQTVASTPVVCLSETSTW